MRRLRETSVLRYVLCRQLYYLEKHIPAAFQAVWVRCCRIDYLSLYSFKIVQHGKYTKKMSNSSEIERSGGKNVHRSANASVMVL